MTSDVVMAWVVLIVLVVTWLTLYDEEMMIDDDV